MLSGTSRQKLNVCDFTMQPNHTPFADPGDLDDVTERIAAEEHPVGDASEARPHATLTILKGPRLGAVHRLDDQEIVLGRSGDAQVSLPTDGVSRRHASICRQGDVWILRDLGSTNGTICRGRLLREPLPLRDGDRISLGGRVVLRFSIEGELEEALRSQLYELATRDPLTGIYNRRSFEERLAAEWAWVVREGGSLALLLVDIDRFRAVNSQWGHSAGDHVLQHVVACLRGVLRSDELLARVGGEEFAVLCRGTQLAFARTLGELIRAEVSQSVFHWQGNRISVSVSVGVGTSDRREQQAPAQLVERVSHRLQLAQQRGYNRVEDG